jgi:hypothetical protein
VTGAVAGGPPARSGSTAGSTSTTSGGAQPALTGSAGPSGPTVDNGTPPQTAPAPGQPGSSGYQLAANTGPSSQSLYLVVAAGAIVLIGAALLFRTLAVKLAWT